MNIFGARQTVNHEAGPYAAGADFCRIFRQDMDRLYLLAFLLTGDRLTAEKCFVRGLEDAGKGNPVFKEWANSWARRTIVQKAIEMVQPRPAQGAASRRTSEPGLVPPEIGAVVDLPAFERFVFVMSVLERNSDQDCSLLLDCARGEVVAARIRAVQQIGSLAQLRRETAPIEPKRENSRGRQMPAFRPQAASHLPVSA